MPISACWTASASRSSGTATRAARGRSTSATAAARRSCACAATTTREQAEADGFEAHDVEAANDADIICILVPDDVIALLPLAPKADSCVIVASGYTLGFGRLDPPGDSGMVAPRMLGPEVRGCYEEGVGFITAVGVHHDATGSRARARARDRQGDRRPAPGRHRAHADAGGGARPRCRAGALARARRGQQRVRADDDRARHPDRGDRGRARALGRGRAHLPAVARGRLRGAVRVPLADEPVRPAARAAAASTTSTSPRRCAGSPTTSSRVASPTSGTPSATPGYPTLTRLKEQHAGPAVREYEAELRRRLGRSVDRTGPDADRHQLDRSNGEAPRWIGFGSGSSASATSRRSTCPDISRTRAATWSRCATRAPTCSNGVRSEWGVDRTYTELDALLADPDIDAVEILGPTPLHAEHVIAAARGRQARERAEADRQHRVRRPPHGRRPRPTRA